MSTPRAARPIPLALTGLVALFSALVALALTGGHDARAGGEPAAHAGATAAAVTSKELALRNGMRQLWEDHVVWTRLAVIGLLGDTPDADAAVARLLRNQADIGNAVKPFYGRAAGNTLTAELRTHILVAADVIAAAKAGDTKALTEAQARWRANANRIAAVLNSVNPRFFRLGVLKAELRRHLTLTTAEVVARLQGKWAADVAAYDAIHRHILGLSDYLAQGIVAQFPGRFR